MTPTSANSTFQNPRLLILGEAPSFVKSVFRGSRQIVTSDAGSGNGRPFRQLRTVVAISAGRDATRAEKRQRPPKMASLRQRRDAVRLIIVPTFIALAAICWDLAANYYVAHTWAFAVIFGVLGLTAVLLLAVVTNP